MDYHKALTWDLPIRDPKRFGNSTSAEGWSTMQRIWSIEPRSERIVQDISDLERIVDKIIEVNGKVIYGEALRSGRRHIRLDGKGHCKQTPSTCQRKSTLRARLLHPDANESMNRLLNKL